MSIGLYVLAGFAYPHIRSEEAAMKYLLYGAFAAGFLIYGIALIFRRDRYSDMQRIGEALSSNAALARDPLLLAGLGLIVIGFGYKISMVPFHMWTPDVYEGAPTPVTAYMSAANQGGRFCSIAARLSVCVSTRCAAGVADRTGDPGSADHDCGQLLAVAQNNIKRMLAYSRSPTPASSWSAWWRAMRQAFRASSTISWPTL